MGITFACPFANIVDLSSPLESFLGRSRSYGSNDGRTESASFNGRYSKLNVVNSLGSEKTILEDSLSFKDKNSQTEFLTKSPPDRQENDIIQLFSPRSREIQQLQETDCMLDIISQTPSSDTGTRRHQAALKLQKTYKSFRTRRQLADCAVLVEQRWWKLLDFAVLKRSSISFFDIEKPETAISRWSRARTRAAMVGKGLSKDDKARKLALQHWLEAIDPRHRYGHNLQFYYVKWLQCENKQPFFYWLDIGEGKEVNIERCHRPKLQQQCIKYLGPTERKAYEVSLEDGKFIYKQTGKLIDMRGATEDAKWIFVLSTSKDLYVGQKIKGTFQHSSFLAGGATLSAGRLVVEDGILKAVWPHSGHYLPTEENFEAFMAFLEENKVDLKAVQRTPSHEEEKVITKKESSFRLKGGVSEPDLCLASNETDGKSSKEEKTDSWKNDCNVAETCHLPLSRWSRGLLSKISGLEIPKREELFEILKKEEEEERKDASCNIPSDCPTGGYETAEEYLSDTEFTISKENLFKDEQEDYEEAPVPREKIIQRINSHKGMKSYQLAQQLSCKWTTGAGPRIGCVRDYPSELQFSALEQVHLSPRSDFFSPRTSSNPSSGFLTPTNLHKEAAATPVTQKLTS